MRKTKRLHLWMGLLASVVILLEAATGLLLTERWLLGLVSGGGAAHHATMKHEGPHLTMLQAVQKASETGAFKMEQVQVVMNHGMYMARLNDEGKTLVTIAPNGHIVSQQSNTFSSLVRDLHTGQIGNGWMRIAIDISALAMMFLTGTGIYLSWRTLRAERIRDRNRKRKEQVA